MTTPVRQRIFSFDLLRAFAIVCVVIVHVNGNSWFVLELSPLIKIFSLFFSSVGYLGVPIFVTISGALILPKHRHLIRFFIRRFIRIVPPWVFYTALTVLSYNYLYWLSDQTIVTSNIKHIMYGTYGFVPLIIGLYLITPLIQIILDASATNLSKFIFIWFIFSSLLPALSIFSPQLDLNVPRYLSLQYLGYYLAGYQIIKTPSLNNKLLTTSTAAFFLASTCKVS